MEPICRSLSSLVTSCYAPPIDRRGSFFLERWLGTTHIRYYSLGRHALIAALRLLDIGPGNTVAVPEFICRDLLASFAAVGAVAVYYPVSPGLEPDCAPESLADADVVVAINYFGFPQDMGFFREVAAAGEVAVIEDNAHGFLSRDESGVPLGRRGDVGIFSLRKTVPLPDGGALVVNDEELIGSLPDQLPIRGDDRSRGLLVKEMLRRTVPVAGTGLCRLMTGAARSWRKIRTGHAIAPSPPESEKVVPLGPEPCPQLRDRLSRIAPEEETKRRQQLYLAIKEDIVRLGGRPVFDELPCHVSPYVLPFRADNGQIGAIGRCLASLGLECHRWPELPDSIAVTARQHYLNVWMVPFLW